MNKHFTKFMISLACGFFSPLYAHAVVTYEGSEGMAREVFSICSECHSGQFPIADVRLDNFEDTVINSVRANTQVQQLTMPPNLPLSSSRRELMQQWLDDGTLESAAPESRLQSVTNIQRTQVTLNVGVFENGVNSEFRFIFGTNQNNLNSSATPNPSSPSGSGGGINPATISHTLTGLNCSTTYFFRTVGSNTTFGDTESALASFTTASCTNIAPQITSQPSTSVVLGNAYQYQVRVLDPDDENNGTELTFSILNAPTGMTISNTGQLSWTPQGAITSSGEITIQVRDGGEDGAETASQSFSINVFAQNTAPTITSQAITSATEDQQYQYPVTFNDLDDETNGIDLTIRLENAPQGMNISDAGLIIWTPTEGIISSGEVSVIVEDGGENGVSPTTQTFTISVTPVNDSPRITSQAPQEVLAVGARFEYQVEVLDVDDTNNGSDLSFELINAPTGMEVSTTGFIQWTPQPGMLSSGEVMIQVSDGGEDGATAATQVFTVEVSQGDLDSDGINDADDNCPQIANNNQADNDNDNIGDPCDEDDDNDQLPDIFEQNNNLNPLNASDAQADADGDGRTNLEEFLNNSNPNADDVAPVLSIPNEATINATGYLTYVDLGQASAQDALDGEITPTTRPISRHFRPGRHTVVWSASDAAGNTVSEEQIVNVIPLVSVSPASRAAEGQTGLITVHLNGEALEYPVVIDYSISGGVDENDHDAPVSGRIFITSGTQASLPIVYRDDGISDDQEALLFELTAAENAQLSNSTHHIVTIVEGAFVPTFNLDVVQAEQFSPLISRGAGIVQVVTTINGFSSFEGPLENIALSFDWSSVDNRLVPLNDSNSSTSPIFSFDPSDLAPGLYPITVSVIYGEQRNTQGMVIRISEDAQIDRDNDGITDAQDDDDVSFVLQYAPWEPPLETHPELNLLLGNTAIFANRLGAAIRQEDLSNFGDNGSAAINTDDNFDLLLTDIIDFTLTGFSQTGSSANVVIPLLASLPNSSNNNNTEYRVYHNTSGWQSFVSNNTNEIASARTQNGLCPPPTSNDYIQGLNPGHSCILLTLEDGGPNDTDSEGNATLRMTGRIIQLPVIGPTPTATPTATPTPDNSSDTDSGGSGSMDLITLLMVLSLGLYRLFSGLSIGRKREAI